MIIDQAGFGISPVADLAGGPFVYGGTLPDSPDVAAEGSEASNAPDVNILGTVNGLEPSP